MLLVMYYEIVSSGLPLRHNRKRYGTSEEPDDDKIGDVPLAATQLHSTMSYCSKRCEYQSEFLRSVCSEDRAFETVYQSKFSV